MKKIIEEAFSFHKEGHLTQAKNLYEKILNDNPQNDEVLDWLGLLYGQIGNNEKAIEYIEKAISINPTLYYIENLAKIYLKNGDFTKSIKIYETLIQTREPKYEYWFNLAMSYKNIEEFDKAKNAYYKAIEINPQSHEAYYNLAYICYNENNPQEAVKCYKKALEIMPEDWETEYFLSLALMQIKDYKNGLKAFETRLCRASAIVSQEKTYPNLMKTKPLWKGENIKNKVLYTYYEAGFGDVIMLYRFIPQLTKLCKKLIIKPQKELAPLFRENSYGAEIMEMYDFESIMDFDYHIPFLSIPYTLKAFEKDMFIHHDEGYIKANSAKIKYYKDKYFTNDKFKIGIKWQGNTFYDKERVIKVENFFKLFDIPHTQFYSCQTFEGSEEFEKIKDKYNVIDLGKTFSNFSDTAGAIENMDLIICNDTSLAHLAGAMCKPCWILLPHIYNWRWHDDLSYSDWYDSVKLFRQPKNGDWNTVFEQVYSELVQKI